MGEYANFKGERIKIGTCEDLYYLRADQADLVQPVSGSLDPRDPRERSVIRFRFPWPDEDQVEPGAFEQFDRSVRVSGVTLPAELEHRNMQFTARGGYLVALPCPEGPPAKHGLDVMRNGIAAGTVELVQQAYRGGLLVAICRCAGCESVFRLPTWKDVEPLVVALRAEGDQRGDFFWHQVAERVAAGYLGEENRADIKAGRAS